MCLFPRLINNPKYKSNKKNGGQVPPVLDERVKYVPIGCQYCLECMKKKAREWQVRLQEEIKTSKNGKFISLTFDNENYTKLYKEVTNKFNDITPYGIDNQIATIAVRKFLERWRKEKKKSVRHWMITELGQKNTEHIHIHGIIWTTKFEDIEKHWKYGIVYPSTEKDRKKNYVNARTINYIIKYVNKIDPIHKGYKSIILTSAGIGRNYTKTYNSTKNIYQGTETNETYRTSTGNKIALPIYYRNKIYKEEQREELWLNKLDKQERYVLGRRIDISKGEQEYYKALEQAQKENKELGYGDGNISWEQAEYEKERRKLKQEERINNNKKKKK